MYEKYIGEYWRTLRRHVKSSSRPKSYVWPFTLNPRQLGGIARAGLLGEVAHIGLCAQPVLHRCLERVAVDTQPRPNPPQPAHMHFIPSPSPFLCVVRGPQLGQSQEPPGRPPHGGALAECSSAHQLTTSPPLALLSLSKSKKSQKTFVWDPWCPFHTTWKNETAFSHVYRENRTWYQPNAWQFSRMYPRFSIHNHSKSRNTWRKQDYIKHVGNIHYIVTYFRIKVIKLSKN